MNERFRLKLSRRQSVRLIISAIAAFCGMSSVGPASAVMLGQHDDFQTGPDGWQSGMGPGNVLLDGGPAGDGDSFLEVNANGDFGPFSKLTIFNIQQWTGDYKAAGVSAIEVDLKNFGAGPLSMRVAFKELTGGGGYVSSDPFVVEPDGNWHHARFELASTAFTAVGAQKSFADELTNIAQVRIIHHRAAIPNSLNGDTGLASVGIDNVRAIPEPASTALALWTSAFVVAVTRARARTSASR